MIPLYVSFTRRRWERGESQLQIEYRIQAKYGQALCVYFRPTLTNGLEKFVGCASRLKKSIIRDCYHPTVGGWGALCVGGVAMWCLSYVTCTQQGGLRSKIIYKASPPYASTPPWINQSYIKFARYVPYQGHRAPLQPSEDKDCLEFTAGISRTLSLKKAAFLCSFASCYVTKRKSTSISVVLWSYIQDSVANV